MPLLEETKQKVLNQTFLIVNTLIFPLLGVGSLTALVKALRGVHDDSETAHGKGLGIDEQFVHLIVRQIVLGSPGTREANPAAQSKEHRAKDFETTRRRTKENKGPHFGTEENKMSVFR
eukprot:6036474-Amphidinium_carterae.1